ncbi:TIR domain-containing protein [Catellatospora sp. KI3]|uniref:toll/interleukin-1 receptor domain-containing protein n=1 Tax=Catellatospora sp. KI3 TaxID=3041620 RepID=UPI00248244DC|nr:TIR domain-containing protein [Catellatospora sp. KI3]MDI1461248.1 TIR domain-containing protein [Catellatospora sp. KI3]
MSGRVFLCFSRQHDAAYASRLAAHLAGTGLLPVYDTQPMSDTWWSTYTQAQIDSCDAVVVVMTPESGQDGWVAREIEHARLGGKPIVPLLLRGRPFRDLGAHGHEDVTSGGMPGPDLVRRLGAHPGPGVVPEPSASGIHVPVVKAGLATAIGIEVRGGAFFPLIKPGTAVPCRHSETFTTAEDGQADIGAVDSPLVAGGHEGSACSHPAASSRPGSGA